MNAAGNKIFLSSAQANPLPINDECVASLYDNHVFIEVVYVRAGVRSFSACPEGHLAPINAVKDVALNARCSLIGTRDPVRRMLHEVGEFAHRLDFHIRKTETRCAAS